MSPDRRERILLLVLVGLVLVGGIYYSGSLLSSWQYVYELASESETSSVKRDDKILENPASVRDSVLRRYQNNLADFAGIPLAEVLWGAQGWSGSLDVALRNGSGTDPQGSFEGVFQGTVFFGGLVEGTLRSKSDSWTIRARENSLYVVGDSNQKFQLADVHFRDPAPFDTIGLPEGSNSS